MADYIEYSLIIVGIKTKREKWKEGTVHMCIF